MRLLRCTLLAIEQSSQTRARCSFALANCALLSLRRCFHARQPFVGAHRASSLETISTPIRVLEMRSCFYEAIRFEGTLHCASYQHRIRVRFRLCACLLDRQQSRPFTPQEGSSTRSQLHQIRRGGEKEGRRCANTDQTIAGALPHLPSQVRQQQHAQTARVELAHLKTNKINKN